MTWQTEDATADYWRALAQRQEAEIEALRREVARLVALIPPAVALAAAAAFADSEAARPVVAFRRVA